MRSLLLVLSVVTAVLLGGCSEFTSTRTRSSVRVEDSPSAVVSLRKQVATRTAENANITSEQRREIFVVPSPSNDRELAEARENNERLNRQAAERERVIVELKRCPAPVMVVKPEPKVCQTQPPVPALVPCPVVTPAPTRTHTETVGNEFNVTAGRDVHLNVEIESSTVPKDESQVQKQIREDRRDILAVQGLMDDWSKRDRAHRR